MLKGKKFDAFALQKSKRLIFVLSTYATSLKL